MKNLRNFALVATLGVLATGHPAAQTDNAPASPSAPTGSTPAASEAAASSNAPAGESSAPAAAIGASQPTTEIAVPPVPPQPAAPAREPNPSPEAAPDGGPATSTTPAATSTNAAANANEETFAIDPVHSSVGFRVKHLFSNVTGRFNDFGGTIVGDPAKPEEAKVNVVIQVPSIDTKDGKRDQHLRSDEFFDVEKFPTIQFTSKKVTRTGQDTAFVTGDLTMRGITKEVILQTKFLGRGKGMTGRIHTGWEARTALKRSDFGLTWNKAIEGTQLVGDDIEIDLQIEAVEPKNEAAAPAKPPTPPEKKLPEQDGVVPATRSTPATPEQPTSGTQTSSAPADVTTPVAPAAPAIPPVPSAPAVPEAPSAPSAPAPAPAIPTTPAPSGEQSI